MSTNPYSHHSREVRFPFHYGLCLNVSYRFLRWQLWSVTRDLGIETCFWNSDNTKLFIFTNSFVKYETIYNYIPFILPEEDEEEGSVKRDLGWEILGTEERAESCILEIAAVYVNFNWVSPRFYETSFFPFMNLSPLTDKKLPRYLVIILQARAFAQNRLLPVLFFLNIAGMTPRMLVASQIFYGSDFKNQKT